MESILNTIKKLLGVSVDDTAFDADILVFINSSIAILRQVGVGPEDPLLVVDKDTEWTALTEDATILSMSKVYIHMTTRLAFDPPSNSFTIDAFKRVADELIWRIKEEAEPPIPPEEPVEV